MSQRLPNSVVSCSTLVQLLQQRALYQASQIAYTFLADGETQTATLTYRELDRRARAIGAQLQKLRATGECALLLYPPGLDYIAAFLGCLYAQVIAVPAYPPRLNKPMPRLQTIVFDSQAKVALTTAQNLSNLEQRFAHLPELQALQWLATDNVDEESAGEWQEPAIDSHTLAFLQYTSGSTATPRGVMLTHGNLLHNLSLIHRCFEITPDSRGVIWLPPYHDMGLIGGILESLYGGCTVTLMPPVAFLQNPFQWLRAISRTGSTVSGGPNFAYELCIRKITAEQRATLDLGSWRVAFTGAEPVRPETLDRFVETFAPCGFRPEAFYPCYGLAEGTLIVSGGNGAALPIVQRFSAAALEQRRVEASLEESGARTLVSCGRTLPGQEIVIADPERMTRCPPDRVGEIWVSGPSISQGYWHRPEETALTFQASLADTGQGPFLRTGDLGFLQDGELFVAGRLKDLIIIRGRNHYPQDIELTVEKSHSLLRPDCGAVFSIDYADSEGERLVVVQEIERHHRGIDLSEVAQAIRQAVAENHEVQVYAVVLIKTGSILRTSSGKIQRHACKAGFLQGSLDVVYSDTLDAQAEEIPADQPEASFIRKALMTIQEPATRRSVLLLYLQEQAARVLHLAGSQVNPLKPLTASGLDSLMAIELKHEIETSLGIALPIADVLQEPSLAQLADDILAQFDVAAPMPSIALSPASQPQAEYPLSFGQQSLWFLYQLAPESAAYNVPCAVRIRSPLDVQALHRALQKLVERHPSLRTTFAVSSQGPVQRIRSQAELDFQVVDASAWTQAALDERLAQKAHRPFDLENGPLLHVHVFRRADQEYILLLVMHHIITDFWSLAVLVEELSVLYPAECAGRPASLPPLPAQYTDYVLWQKQVLDGPRGEHLRAYWQQQLSGDLPVLNLPTDRMRPPVQTFHGNVYTLRLSAELTEQLKALSQARGATLNMTLLAAFEALLYRYTDQEELSVGTLSAGRSQADLSGIVGYLVNPIVLRARFSPKQTFTDLLDQTRQTLLAGLEYQDYPFNLLVDQLQPARDFSRSPLFQVMFVFQRARFNAENLTAFGMDISGAQMELAGLRLESVALEHRDAQFDLTLTMGEAEGGLIASFEYNTDLFEADSVARMAAHLQTLLEGVAANPQRRLSSLLLLPEEEWLQLLAAWQSLETDYPHDMPISALFEAQVKQTPDAVAVVFDNEQLTYQALDRRADQLAAHLHRLSVRPEAFVGVCVERSLEMIVAVLGILKAGAAYVPLDPSYPPERLALLLADTRASALLTQKHVGDSLKYEGPVICLDDNEWTIAQDSQAGKENAVGRATGLNAACIIYTSGSTGQPKGVVLEHRGIVNLIHSFIHSYQPTTQDKILPLTSVSSASFVGEIFPLLCVGGTLVLPQEEQVLDLESLFDLMARQAVSIISTVPAVVASLNVRKDSLPDVRLILSGGEALGASDVESLLGSTTIVNGYGLTETTICSTFYNLKPEDFHANAWVPIGHPIINTEVYVLDSDLNCLPIGCRGELYVAGDGLARGYWGNPELTAECFVPNPYEMGQRMYRTGDMARWLPDGALEYLHRADHQVKIRGYRIEIGEVESTIRRHPAVRDAYVMIRQDTSGDGQTSSGDKRMVAYVVPAGQALTTSDLYQWLKEKLPLYMVPSAFVLLETLPLLPNGKVDVRALPAPEGTRPSLVMAYAAPQSEAERAIAAIWQAVLKIEQVGIHDNFFELGGNSLLIAQAHHRLREELKCDLSLVDMFKYPTVSALAQHISREQSQAPLYQDVKEQAQKRKQALRQREQRVKQRLRS